MTAEYDLSTLMTICNIESWTEFENVNDSENLINVITSHNRMCSAEIQYCSRNMKYISFVNLGTRCKYLTNSTSEGRGVGGDFENLISVAPIATATDPP